MLLERLVEKAIRGEVRLEELRGLRDWDWCGKDGWVIFDDLESGVEHFPGHFFGGGPDWETWHSSPECFLLSLDLLLLRSELCCRSIIACRKAADSVDFDSESEVREFVASFINDQR